MTERIAVLGVDPSLRGLAYALVHSSFPNDPHEGVAKSNPAKDVRARVERYKAIVEPVVELARLHKPRVVLIENYAYGVNGFGVIDRAELGGVLRCSLAPHCEVMLEIGTSTLKKWAAGFGGGGKLPPGLTEQQRKQQLARRRKDSKNAVRKGLTALYGVSFEGADKDDQADAFALMKIGACLVGLDEPRNDAQREVLKGLRQKAAA
jgi:Holliday junction resolvasome RuvABC endonuclease subunit